MLLDSGDDDIQKDLHDYVCCNTWYSLTPAAAERHRPPRGRATASRPAHTAAKVIIGEDLGANAQLGERGAWKGALPGMGLLGPRYCGGAS